MNKLMVFENNEYGKFKVYMIDSKPYFPASECAKVLGYSNPRKAIADHCKHVTKRDTLTPGGLQQVNYIPEGDLYRLIARSKLPSTEKFEVWIFDEVLPTIRKTGAYFNIPKTHAEALRLAADQMEKVAALEEQAEINRPKVEFHDAVMPSTDTIDMGEAAKILNIEGIGRNRLFEILREKRILDKDNEPYQKYMKSGYFHLIPQPFKKPNGETGINTKTEMSMPGLDFIRKVLLEHVQQSQENLPLKPATKKAP